MASTLLVASALLTRSSDAAAAPPPPPPRVKPVAPPPPPPPKAVDRDASPPASESSVARGAPPPPKAKDTARAGAPDRPAEARDGARERDSPTPQTQRDRVAALRSPAPVDREGASPSEPLVDGERSGERVSNALWVGSALTLGASIGMQASEYATANTRCITPHGDDAEAAFDCMGSSREVVFLRVGSVALALTTVGLSAGAGWRRGQAGERLSRPLALRRFRRAKIAGGVLLGLSAVSYAASRIAVYDTWEQCTNTLCLQQQLSADIVTRGLSNALAGVGAGLLLYGVSGRRRVAIDKLGPTLGRSGVGVMVGGRF